MKNILLVVHIENHFIEFSRLARFLSASGKYKPVLWFNYNYATLERDLDVCRSEGWGFECVFPSSSTKGSTFNSIWKSLKRFLFAVPEKFHVPFRYEFYSWYRYIRETPANKKKLEELACQARTINAKYKIALIVLAEDNIGFSTHVIIRSGANLGIPTLIMPYTISNATEAAECFYHLREFIVSEALINRLVAKKYPHWVYEYRDRKLFRFPPSAIVAMETSSFPCDRPWRLNNESSSIIAVENAHMLEYYRNEGLEENRLVVTGAIYDDVLASLMYDTENSKKKLYHELNLVENQPILLCALPPNQFPRECEFRDYTSLITNWLQALASVQGWNVIVRPHPRQTQKDIAMLEGFGVKITTLDTASLVPLCDLYVASVSATIRWAIACGKPVINYDVYQMRYKDYSESKGVLTVCKREEFTSILKRLTTDAVYFDDMQRAQQADSQFWGILDGKSSARILALIDDTIAGKYKEKNK